MKPIDYRNESFEQVSARLGGLRATVFAAWEQYGPCSTEDLAERSGISVLTVRPRTTDLYQMGFVVLASDGPRGGHGGIYRAATYGERLAHFHAARREALEPQLSLNLGNA